ncbi:aqualysin-1-like [Ptychodera flava]|uniref:aqualysin-1-like n=1 Tax=Ptychodera flava TaxID=63121 RepID=UPI00396A3A47
MDHKIPWIGFVLALSFVPLLLASALAPLHRANPLERIPNSFVVVLKDNCNELDLADVITKTEILSRRYRFEVKITNKYTKVYLGYSLEVSDKFVEVIRSIEEVEYVEEDSMVYARQSRIPWNLDRLDQRDLPLDNVFNPAGDGSGVNAYVVDTGIRYTHSEFGGRALPFYDFQSGDGSDCHGHGTHAAGVIGGLTQGVAKNVQLHSVRILNCAGTGTIAQIIGGLDFLASNGQSPGVASVAISSGPSLAFDNAVRGVINAGFQTAIAAGGSSADACNVSPARIEEGITVAGSGSRDTLVSSSNTGPCVHIVAPGESIRSAWHTGDFEYRVITGTSSAAAHAAGVCAVILQETPTLTPEKVKNELILDSTNDRLNNVPVDTPNLLTYTSAN